MCPEAWHRQDLICYVGPESGLIRRDERGCLIKFTFHFLTWHQSPVTHGTDGNTANKCCQNLVGETDWEMRRQKRERKKRTVCIVFIWGSSNGNTSSVAGEPECWTPLYWKEQVCWWETWGRHLGTDVIQLPTGQSYCQRGIYGLNEEIKFMEDWKWFISAEIESRSHPKTRSKTGKGWVPHPLVFPLWNHSVCINFLLLSNKLSET